MIIENISLWNVGPIREFFYKFPEQDDGRPKPVVFVGQNGSGKSTLLSVIVSALINAKQMHYDDVEVEKNRTYRLRSGSFVSTGANESYSRVDFQGGFYEMQIELHKPRRAFEEEFGYTLPFREWSQMQDYDRDHLSHNFDNSRRLQEAINGGCALYFPPNRFEEPSWLNSDSLLGKAEHSEARRLASKSGRKIVVESNLHQLKNWILDVFFDTLVLETRTINGVVYCEGRSSKFFQTLTDLAKLLYPSRPNIKIGIDRAPVRRISLNDGEEVVVSNLFALSSGESTLFSLFFSILKDFDSTLQPYDTPSDIKGVVLIDEIELHLHTVLQKDVLPRMMSFFPNLQFVVTTHSPLFLLGMRDTYGDDGFAIVDMPQGVTVSAEDFSEFEEAYLQLKETQRFRRDVQERVESSKKPLVFLEGQIDVDYVKRAAELLGKKETLERVELLDGGGAQKLKAIWNTYEKTNISRGLQNKMILYFDCDQNIQEEGSNDCYKRVIHKIENSPIDKGIENLFPENTIRRLLAQDNRYFNRTDAHTKQEAGETIEVPEKIEIHPDQKRNLCNAICDTSDPNDFKNFCSIFEAIEHLIALQHQLCYNL